MNNIIVKITSYFYVFYFAEHVFQDGIIAQAVTTVSNDGALYFSSAGNSGNLNDATSGVWEGDFVPIAAPPVLGAGVTWMDAFLGNIPGSIGETSAIACLLGGAFLMFTGIASWRIVAGVFLGMVASALLFNVIGSDSNRRS